MRTIIKNGHIFTESEDYQADLLIEGGKIVCVGRKLPGDEAEIIDAKGCYILPGAVDVHTHMDLDVGISRAVDDFYDGTVAAACGGTTAIVDHMAFGPAGVPLHHQFEVYKKLAEGKAVIDYGFHGTAQHVNDEILEELAAMASDGIPSVKVYLTYGFRLNDADVLQILQKMKEVGGVTAFHCENHEVVEFLKQKYKLEGKTAPVYHAKSRPNLAEAEAVSRVLNLARMADDAPVYIVHLSCKESLEAVRDARRHGQKNIFVETCPQYLVLTEECYRREDGLKYILSPPLRTREDCEALWEGIADGAPGVEERLMLMFSEGAAKGRITMNQLVKTLCAEPSRIYGLYPEKGVIQPGADADLVILDPRGSYVMTQERMHGAADYTAYEGMQITGEIRKVLQRGKVIADGGKFLGKKGDGRFIRRKGLN